MTHFYYKRLPPPNSFGQADDKSSAAACSPGAAWATSCFIIAVKPVWRFVSVHTWYAFSYGKSRTDGALRLMDGAENRYRLIACDGMTGAECYDVWRTRRLLVCHNQASAIVERYHIVR